MFEFSSAVVIAVPHEVQAIAVPIMRQYSRDTLIRFRPHITLLFPFVPYNKLDSACEMLHEVAATIAPFEVTLADYGEFPGVIYMKPTDPAPIKAMFHKLYAAFPDYPPYEGAFGDDLQPHMTVAQFATVAERASVSLLHYPPITFQVDRLHLWYGAYETDLPWLTYTLIPLRG